MSPTRRVHPVTIAVVGVGLFVTASLVVASAVAHDRTEDRLLDQRSHEAATVAASSISELQGLLTSASVAAELDDGGRGAFRSLVEPTVGPDLRFVSASVWSLSATDVQPSVVVGAAPLLQDEDPTARRAFLTAAVGRDSLSIRDHLERGDRRLGYAFAVPGATSVVYFEAALPNGRPARVASDSAFADLDYALYLGDRADPARLLASSSGGGLRGGRTERDAVPFGDASILLVVAPRGQLGGELLAWLPWVLAAVGLLMTVTAAFLAERLVRRRERAEELSDRLEEVAEENVALYERQRQVAEQLQRSLMPRTLPQLQGLEAAGRYQAGIADTEVGGDWYDVVPLSDSRLAFSVGDVCGRGLAAAALMASLRYSIRAYALEQSDPAAILEKLSAMVESTADDVFATVICGTFDARSGVLTLARAGHPAPLVVEGRRARYLDVPVGPPVGVRSERPYEAAMIRLAGDAVLLAFTDGLVERRGEHLDEGLERLRVAAEAELPMVELVSHVVDVLSDADAHDDVAVLALHWTPATATLTTTAAHPSSAAVALGSSRDAPAAARRFLRDTLVTSGLNGAGEVVELLASEVVTNAVQHAGSNMQLRVTRGASSIRVEVDDESEEMPQRQNQDSTAERGRGVFLIDALAAAWGVDYHDAGKTVWFEVDIPTSASTVAHGERDGAR